jgi:hypothetical protein
MSQKDTDYFCKLAMESRAAALRAPNESMRGIWLDAEECWLALASEVEAVRKITSPQVKT